MFTFAAPAWSSTHERIAIENRLSDLQPDLVLELTGIADALYGERGHNVLWARALTDQYYWDLVNIALRRAGFAPMADVQDTSSERVPPELVAARLQKNVRLASGALSLANARLHVFLQPAIVTTDKPLTQHEKGLRFGKSGYFTDPEYYKECYQRIAALLGDRGVPANAAFTNLAGLFDRVPETQDIFLDSYHFGDRGKPHDRAGDRWRRIPLTLILGISAFYHDSAAALLRDGEIVAAAQEERFTRKKHDEGFPHGAVDYCLRTAGCAVADLDYVGFYEKPLAQVRAPAADLPRVRAERLRVVSAGAAALARAEAPHPARARPRPARRVPRARTLFADHHESHAASAFFPSPFEEAAILTLDGVGEWSTASFGVGRGHRDRA